jgi:hypothetical protein
LADVLSHRVLLGATEEYDMCILCLAHEVQIWEFFLAHGCSLKLFTLKVTISLWSVEIGFVLVITHLMHRLFAINNLFSSTAAPGYFNDDDVLDFMMHVSPGSWPHYNYSVVR